MRTQPGDSRGRTEFQRCRDEQIDFFFFFLFLFKNPITHHIGIIR